MGPWQTGTKRQLGEKLTKAVTNFQDGIYVSLNYYNKAGIVKKYILESAQNNVVIMIDCVK